MSSENNNISTPTGENNTQQGLVTYSVTSSSANNDHPEDNNSPDIVVVEDKKSETPTKTLESPKSPTDSFSSVDYEALDKDWSFGGDDCVVIEPTPSTTVAAVETPA